MEFILGLKVDKNSRLDNGCTLEDKDMDSNLVNLLDLNLGRCDTNEKFVSPPLSEICSQAFSKIETLLLDIVQVGAAWAILESAPQTIFVLKAPDELKWIKWSFIAVELNKSRRCVLHGKDEQKVKFTSQRRKRHASSHPVGLIPLYGVKGCSGNSLSETKSTTPSSGTPLPLADRLRTLMLEAKRKSDSVIEPENCASLYTQKSANLTMNLMIYACSNSLSESAVRSLNAMILAKVAAIEDELGALSCDSLRKLISKFPAIL